MYAIMVWFDNDWMYVTKDDNPIVYRSSLEAEDAADIWRLKDKEHLVKIVTYTLENEL